MQEIYKIKHLEQIRLLSDPLKLQLLQAFAEDPKTTKQVATQLGESITKLYRHVDALFGAGLLEITGEKQKRGTIERTFRAIAQRFEADHSLFSEDGSGDGINAARDILRAVEDEIVDVLANAKPDEEEEALLARLRCKRSPEQIEDLRKTLVDWIDSTQQESEEDTENTQEFGALIAFYPVNNENK